MVEVANITGWGFPKITGTFLKVPLTGIITFLGCILESPIWGRYNFGIFSHLYSGDYVLDSCSGKHSRNLKDVPHMGYNLKYEYPP